MKYNRKANANMVVSAIVSLGIGVIVIAVIAIMLGAFQTDLITGSAGCNSTVLTGCGYDFNVTVRGLDFLDNATSKFSTAGTIVGVLFLLGIIGLGGMLGYQGYQKMRN